MKIMSSWVLSQLSGRDNVELCRSKVCLEDDWLRRIGPAHFGHINFRGTMQFGIERFAQSLVADQAGSIRHFRLV